MVQVVACVVADEWQHRHWVAADHAGCAGSGRGGLRGQGRTHEDAVGPAAGFGHQRDGGLAAAAEEDRVDLHAVWRVVVVREHVDLVDRGAEARVRVRCRTAGLRSPVVAQPVGQVRWSLVGHAFPPDAALIGQRNVGEDVVALGDGAHGVRVGGPAGARSHAEQAVLRVDAAQLAVLADAHPVDVIAQSFGLPAFDGWIQQRQVGLAAGRWEGRGNVVRLVLRAGQLQDEHVLCEPAFIAGHGRGDAQRVALLAQQRVAAVARTVGHDGALFREVHDPLVFVAWPWNIFLAWFQGCADRVQGRNEEGVLGFHLA